MRLLQMIITFLTAFLPLEARAYFTTIDISSYVNNNVTLNPSSFPTGANQNGNLGSTVPFDLSTFGAGGYLGSWIGINSLDVSVNIPASDPIFALLNNFGGAYGSDEYDVTFKFASGQQYVLSSIGGVNTRDYNNYIYTNTITEAGTSEWFNNGLGQRLDVRQFDLPGNFAGQTVTDFIITSVNTNDPAVFSGLTYADSSSNLFTDVPEPNSLALLLGGILTAAWGAHRRYR